MIVVAIIAVLAGLAVFSYSQIASDTKFESEVRAVFAELEQRQEQHFTERGTYLSTGSSDGDTHPSTPRPPRDEPSELHPLPDTWQELRVDLGRPAAHCSYVTIAGDAGDISSAGSIATGTFNFEPPARDWYYLLAECDLGRDENEFHFARSDSDQVVTRTR